MQLFFEGMLLASIANEYGYNLVESSTGLRRIWKGIGSGYIHPSHPSFLFDWKYIHMQLPYVVASSDQ